MRFIPCCEPPLLEQRWPNKVSSWRNLAGSVTLPGNLPSPHTTDASHLTTPYLQREEFAISAKEHPSGASQILYFWQFWMTFRVHVNLCLTEKIYGWYLHWVQIAIGAIFCGSGIHLKKTDIWLYSWNIFATESYKVRIGDINWQFWL